MIYTRPDYFSEFHCIADKCPETCCAGWQIVIDDSSLQYYKTLTGAYADVLRSRIDFREGCFHQDSCKRCAFLKEDNLCDMYEHLGEESLCLTCTNYPRHIEEFENIREITLSLSCPEAAHIILSRKDPVTFCSEEADEPEETFEDYDPFYFSYLEDAREVILHLLQDRSLDIWVRYVLVLKFGQEMQDYLENCELFNLVDLFDRYEDPDYLDRAKAQIMSQITSYTEDAESAFSYSKSLFSFLYELEFLSDDWQDYLDGCWKILYESGITNDASNNASSGTANGTANYASNYAQLHSEFRSWLAAGSPSKPEIDVSAKQFPVQFPMNSFSIDIVFEQLLVYFIFTYFCGAVYDDNVLGKIHLTLNSVFYLYEMMVVRWFQNGRTLSLPDVEEIAYRYSRELEHSDLNLEKMEGV
ncbi:MAG: flagellin lysine-N-methylase, partial [Lachnospiraceae bacterium]